MQGISVATEIVEYTQSFITLLWHKAVIPFSHTQLLYMSNQNCNILPQCVMKRQNTEHAMAGPQIGLHKGSSQSQFQEDCEGQVPVSGTPSVLLEMALLQLTSGKDCCSFGSVRAALVTPGKGLACCSSQQHPFSITFLLTSFKLQTEGDRQVILFLQVPNVSCDAHFPKHGCILALLWKAAYICPPARLAGSEMQVP